MELTLVNGMVLDCNYWPGIKSLMTIKGYLKGLIIYLLTFKCLFIIISEYFYCSILK
jgi:hypothetical protein